MAPLLCLASLLWTPPVAAQPVGEKADIAIMPFDRRKLDTELSETLTDSFQITFAKASRLHAIGQSDIATVLGFEKQKALVGCDEGSCLAEIGGALGVRYLVSGRFARIGRSYVITVKLMDAQYARLIASDQETVDSTDEQALLEGVQSLAERFGKEAGKKIRAANGEPPAPEDSTTTSAKQKPNAPAEATPVAATPEPTRRERVSTTALPPSPDESWRNWLIAALGSSSLSMFSFMVGLVTAVLGTVVGAYAGGSYGAIAGFLCSVPCGLCWIGSCVSFAVFTPLTINRFMHRNDAIKEFEAEQAALREEEDDDEEDEEKPAPVQDAAAEPERTEEPPASSEAPPPAPAKADPPPPAEPAPNPSEESLGSKKSVDPAEKAKQDAWGDVDEITEDDDEDEEPRKRKRKKRR